MALLPSQFSNLTGGTSYNPGRSSNPTTVIDNRITNNSLQTFVYPPDISKYQFYIVEFDPIRIDLTGVADSVKSKGQEILKFLTDSQNILSNNNITNEERLAQITRLNDSFYSSLGNSLGTVGQNLAQNIQNFVEGYTQLRGEKLYRIPLPTPLVDLFSVQYDQNYGYLDSVAGIGRPLQAAAGITVNSFKTITLNSPQYRSFSFKWKFSPKTFNESVILQRMLYSLRKGMTPKRGPGGTKAILQFPKVYGLYFYPNVKFLYKFKPCVITDMAVDYSGGNEFPGFFRQQNVSSGTDGNDFAGINPENSPPESVALQLKFLELEYWLDDLYDPSKSDYKLGSDGLPTSDPFDSWNFYSPTNL